MCRSKRISKKVPMRWKIWYRPCQPWSNGLICFHASVLHDSKCDTKADIDMAMNSGYSSPLGAGVRSIVWLLKIHSPVRTAFPSNEFLSESSPYQVKSNHTVHYASDMAKHVLVKLSFIKKWDHESNSATHSPKNIGFRSCRPFIYPTFFPKTKNACCSKFLICSFTLRAKIRLSTNHLVAWP